MSGINKVVWAEGVFLGQQHFQAWDRQLHDRIAFGLNVHVPFFWGISALEWSRNALREGRFELEKLDCVLPNGQVISFNRDHDEPISIDLKSVGRDECVISLVVPENGVVAGVAGYQSDSRVASWVADYKDLPDENDPARVREVLMAKPNIMLRSDRDISERAQVMRLVKVQKQYDGDYQVVSEVLPPCLTVSATAGLRELVKNSIDMLVNLVREFAKNRAKVGDISSYSSTEMAEFLFHKDLALLLPELQQFSDHVNLHPYNYYQVMAKLHQTVAIYFHPESVGRIVDYKHDAIDQTMMPILSEIRSMLALRKERPEDLVQLSALSPGRFETNEIPRHALENYSFYLAVDCRQDSVEWVNQFTMLCKLASIDQIDAIVSSGLPGVQIKHVQRLPQKIRIKSGYEYFQIKTDGELWDAVVIGQRFGIFCMGQFSDATIELIMLEEK